MSDVVVKLGGHALDELSPKSAVLRGLADDIRSLKADGRRVVVVHGGGPQIAELLGSVGRESRFHEGLRITDAVTMDYVAMALSGVNLRIVAALNHSGVACIGCSGADGTLFVSRTLGEPWAFAGGAPVVRSVLLEGIWNLGLTPVLCSVAVDSDGQLLNCNADSVAGAVAGALPDSVLVLLSDIDQLRADPDSAETSLATVTSGEVRQLVASGAARDGMRPKMVAALDALDGGATRIVMANGTRPHALAGALAKTVPTTEVLP